MKTGVVIPLVLLFAGCASQHSYYTADRPHTQTDALIAESNRFPEPGHRDTYNWYQKDTSRNINVGGHEQDYPAYGPTGPVEGYGYGNGYGPPNLYW